MEKITHIIFDHDGTLVNTSVYEKYVYEGLEDLIKTLFDKGIHMYVWTARGKSSTESILSSLGMRKYFRDICGQDSAPMKPSPAGIEYLIPEVNPDNVIVIGDSIGDIMGARSFGARAIGVTWERESEAAREYFMSSGAYAVYSKVADLKKLILENI